MDHLFTLLICLAASTNSLWIPPNCTSLFLCQSTLSRLLLWLSFALFSLCSLTNDETLKDEEMQTALYELFRSLELANWLWKPFLLSVVPLLRKKRACTEEVKLCIYDKAHFLPFSCMYWSMPSFLRRTNFCRRCWLGAEREHSVCPEAAVRVQDSTDSCSSRRAELSV